MLSPELIFLEAICIVLIGTGVHLARNKVRDLNLIIDDLAVALGVGVAMFSVFGEPSRLNVLAYLYGGYASGEVWNFLVKPWWEAD